jgi:hypothetical protein
VWGEQRCGGSALYVQCPLHRLSGDCTAYSVRETLFARLSRYTEAS